MRRFWLFTICGLLLAVAIPLLAAYCPRILLPSQCSPLYQRYWHTPGIEASYVKGFRINDTLAIDATLLHATDSASWEQLREELRIPEPHPKVAKSIKKGKDIIKVYLSRKGGAAQEMDKENPNNNDVVGVSYLNQSISIYHTCSKEQRTAIINYNYDISPNKQ